MLRVALIGCGKIADQHIQAIGRLPESQVVAVCDRELLMARQLAVRFGIDGIYDDAAVMLREAKPDVVHISTPPQSHFSLGKQCLEAGCHVYLEKPFTVTAEEAEELIRLAQEQEKLITAGHNYQFTPEMRRMRGLIAQGIFAGPPVHLESHWGYDLGDTVFVGAFVGSKDHWVRRLPGQLFHNLISHGIARLTEFLDDEVMVSAHAFQSEEMSRLGGAEVMDELRVVIQDGRGTTAFFCFSTQIKPGLNELRLCGQSGSLTVNLKSGSLVLGDTRSYKSYLTYFVPPFLQSWANLRNGCGNLWAFLMQRLHQDFGMKDLIELFHERVRKGGAPPIPYRELLLTARIMDEVFRQMTVVRNGIKD